MGKMLKGDDKIFRKKPLQVVCHKCSKRFYRYGTNQEIYCESCWDKSHDNRVFDREKISKVNLEWNRKRNALADFGLHNRRELNALLKC